VCEDAHDRVEPPQTAHAVAVLTSDRSANMRHRPPIGQRPGRRPGMWRSGRRVGPLRHPPAIPWKSSASAVANSRAATRSPGRQRVPR